MHPFQASFLAERLARPSEMEDAVIENLVCQSKLIEKYDEEVIFSKPADPYKTLLVKGDPQFTQEVNSIANTGIYKKLQFFH